MPALCGPFALVSRHFTKTHPTLTSLFALTLTLLTGCPGTLDEAMFLAAREGGRPNADAAQEGGSTGACPATVTDVQRDLLVPRCATAGCHTTADRIAGLDLESADLRARLIGVQASMGTCMSRSLVTVTGNAVTGVLLSKLSDTPSCGLRMPLGRGSMPFSADEVSCLSSYLLELSRSGGSDAGAPSDAGAMRDATARD